GTAPPPGAAQPDRRPADLVAVPDPADGAQPDWFGQRRPDLQGCPPGGPRRGGLPEHLQPIVQQLHTGATDVTASRQLGLSPRTYSRRVSELLEYLGVESRFQAGAEAARRGWLPAAGPGHGAPVGAGHVGASVSALRPMPAPRPPHDAFPAAEAGRRYW
ncbi:MAG TPA: hypothetical protein VGD67_22080, partial [Pseudonocardiaceae bacterium]